MYYYPYDMNMNRGYYANNNNRQFFFPFLTGALVGGAAVGLTRPRPIVNAAPNYGPGYGPGPGSGYGPRPPYGYGYNYGYGFYH